MESCKIVLFELLDVNTGIHCPACGTLLRVYSDKGKEEVKKGASIISVKCECGCQISINFLPPI